MVAGNTGSLMLHRRMMNANDTLTIRDATPEDRDAIRDDDAGGLRTVRAGDDAEPLARILHAHLLETLAADDAPFIVAELDGAIVGSVRLVPPKPVDAPDYRPGGEWPEVSILAVAPEARGKGIAAALLDECIRQARESGATTLGLHTEEAMAVALDMYLRRGFVRAPETDFYPDEEWHVMGFRLDLNEFEV